MNRKQWRKVYRMLRVARRESLKAAMDAMIYGTGVVMMPKDGGDPRCIRPSDIYLTPDIDVVACEYPTKRQNMDFAQKPS